MRQGLAIWGTGVALGLALSWLAARAIAAALYGVGAADPAAWSSAVGVMLLSAALANYLPARRAARVDPSIALRTRSSQLTARKLHQSHLESDQLLRGAGRTLGVQFSRSTYSPAASEAAGSR